MAKDPNPKRRGRKGEDFSDLYQNDVEFDEEDFVDEDDDDEELVLDDDDVDWDEDDEEEDSGRRGRREGKEAKPGPLGKLRERMRPKPVRPGEQDPLQSPIVLGLFGGTLLLTLVGGILWFIIGRQSSQKAFDAAQEKLDTGQYAQAIQLFQNFQDVYPTHKLLPDARIGEGKATILQFITGGSPEWDKGLEALENFIRDFKDEEEFDDLKPELKRFASEIAEGSAKTAGEKHDRSLLEVSPKALLIAKRYTAEGLERDELEARVNKLLVAANDSIVKQETYLKAVAEIEKALAEKPPRTLDGLHIREDLIQRYPDVASNRKIRQLLAQTLDAEKALVTAEKIEAQVSQQDHPQSPARPVALVTQSQTRSDQETGSNTVFGLAKGSLLGVDAATGTPIWRRSIGLDVPFFPKRIETETPGILVYDTSRGELLALAERTGELIWRLPMPSDPAGGPSEQGNFLYFASTDQRLYKIDMATGTLVGTLRFTQNVLSPPIPAPDGQHMIAVGDSELMYTIESQNFSCIAVTHAGHKRGTATPVSSVDAPLVKMGDLILLAENDKPDSSLLRVFRMAEPDEPIKQVDLHRIAGQVRDAPALRGNQLYVPSSGERFTAFAVSDDPNLDDDPKQHALSLLSNQKVQAPYDGPMNLLALEGQVWIATSALRRMENNSGSLAMVGEPMAVGASAQPIQQLGDELYLGRHRAYSSATLLTQFQTETFKTNWGLVMGSSILAASANNGSLVCVNEDGHVYKIAESAFAGGGNSAVFQTEPSVTLNLPEDLASPLGAVALQDGSLFVYAGGAEPTAWFITPQGLMDHEEAIPRGLEALPAPVRDGVVLPLANRLRFIPRKRTSVRVDDYSRKLEVDPPKGQSPPVWMHVKRLDDDQVIAVDSAGVLVRIQFRTDGKPHLFEARNQQLPSPVNVPFLAFAGTVVLADADKQLHVLDGQSFQVLGSAPLPAAATNALWLAGTTVLVETGGTELHAFAVTPKPQKLWSVPLENSSLAGAPLLAGQRLVIAKQNGEVLAIDPANGNVQKRHSLGQALKGDLLSFGNQILALGLDGSLHPLTPVLSAGQ